MTAAFPELRNDIRDVARFEIDLALPFPAPPKAAPMQKENPPPHL